MHTNDNALIFVDTETTGLNRSKGKKPGRRICQLAFKKATRGGQVVTIFSSFVRPKGWKVPKSATRVHGITQEDCETHGKPIEEILTTFSRAALGCDLIIAHNAGFDRNVIAEEMDRLGMVMPTAEWYCTMAGSRNIVGIQKVGRGGKIVNKPPKLSEAYAHFTGRFLYGAHDALVDVDACMAVYEGICSHHNFSPRAA